MGNTGQGWINPVSNHRGGRCDCAGPSHSPFSTTRGHVLLLLPLWNDGWPRGGPDYGVPGGPGLYTLLPVQWLDTIPSPRCVGAAIRSTIRIPAHIHMIDGRWDDSGFDNLSSCHAGAGSPECKRECLETMCCGFTN